MGKESQIMNEEIIHTIESDKNLVNSSILESKINFLNKNIEKIEGNENPDIGNEEGATKINNVPPLEPKKELIQSEAGIMPDSL